MLLLSRQILSLLSDTEVKLVVPTHAITPRTFILKPGMVLFLGALARIDYLEVRIVSSGFIRCYKCEIYKHHTTNYFTCSCT